MGSGVVSCMDETAAALLDLKGEIGDLKGEVGKLTGQMSGLGREIGDLKDLMSNDGSKCLQCKAGIESQIAKVDDKVEDLKAHGASISQQNAEDIKIIKKKIEVFDRHCTSEEDVKTSWDKFWNNSIARWGTVAALALVCIGWFLQWKGIL